MTTPTEEQFAALPIRAEIVTAVASLDYVEMTPVQRSALPAILDGKDVIAQAKTGSGKTAAFAIGLINQLNVSNFSAQALVLCPTRELADQVAAEIRRLASALANTKILTLCGGKPMYPQVASLKQQPHIVVGTPGRILKHLEKGNLQLGAIKTLVLDEADRMLDMGFYDDIMLILNQSNSSRQTLLFSATYNEGVRGISKQIQNDPVDVTVETSHRNEQIKQTFYSVTESDKTRLLFAVLNKHQPESSLVFCNRKHRCQEVAAALQQNGFYAKALHGDLEQFERDQALIQFSNNSTSVLVATDVAARGLDITELSAVINFDLSPEPDIHVHRTGRTGRAGKDGIAISFVQPEEKHRVRAIEIHQDSSFKVETLKIAARNPNKTLLPPTVTLRINAGRKDKLRPGDIVGALTSTNTMTNDRIGKITMLDNNAYVAVERDVAKQALKILTEDKIKGRRFKVHSLR